MILNFCIIIFLSQVSFIAFRTWNVRAVAENNLIAALISGALLHLCWMVTIGIGSVSIKEIIINFNYTHIPVALASVLGGGIGTVIGMYKKKKP